jgi:hypothetical protein
MNQANAIRNPPVTLDSIDHSPVVESENVNLTFLLVWFFVFEAFVRVEDIFPVIESLRLVQGPPLDVSGPERSLARHSTKRAFQWR